MSRMLVTDPKQRATMQEVMSHPWMIKGYNGPPESFLPLREPLTLPLDQEVINSMTGFNFGPPEVIRAQLTKTLESEEYCRAVRQYYKERDLAQPNRDVEKRRMLGFDFYKRRSSSNSRDNLSAPSTEAFQLGGDPLTAFSPLISIYQLVREKQERDLIELAPPSPQPATPRNEVMFTAGIPNGDSSGAMEAAAVSTHDYAAHREVPFDATVPPVGSAVPHPPEEAHTNNSTYEMGGGDVTGGRMQPRSRTQGEDDDLTVLPARPGPTAPASPRTSEVRADAEIPPKREGAAAGLLRRFSTRRRAVDKSERSHPPLVQIQTHSDGSTALRKSFSIRRSRRERDEDAGTGSRVRSGSSQPRPSEHLLSPPLPSLSTSRGHGLGRSTSVNSADMRRRVASQGLAIQEVPMPGSAERSAATVDRGPAETLSQEQQQHQQPCQPPKVSQQQSTSMAPFAQATRSVTMRAKTLGHARRESIQLRRQRREEARDNVNNATDVADGDQERSHDHSEHGTTDHEHDGDQGEQSGVSTDRLGDEELAKPVFLKGLFSVSTTSPKSVPDIRAEIRRVLKRLDVDYTEIKGGFSCRHAPSIDLDKIVDPPASPAVTPGHRRRFSFGALRGAANYRDRDEARPEADQPRHHPPTPRAAPKSSPYRGGRGGGDSDSSMESMDAARDEAYPDRRPPGETSTQVQSDLGGSMVVEFEIFIVKVPLFSLHGIQFKRMMGNTWQFKNMADHILRELRL